MAAREEWRVSFKRECVLHCTVPGCLLTIVKEGRHAEVNESVNRPLVAQLRSRGRRQWRCRRDEREARRAGHKRSEESDSGRGGAGHGLLRTQARGRDQVGHEWESGRSPLPWSTSSARSFCGGC